MHKHGAVVDVSVQGRETKDGTEEFTIMVPQAHETLGRSRIFAVDTESLLVGGHLTTVLATARFPEHTETLRPDDGPLIEQLFELILREYGVAADNDRASRRKNRKNKNARAGLDPCVAVWFNMPYDLGRLLAHDVGTLRSLASGADTFKRMIGPYELTVAKLHLGSSSSFEFFIRRDLFVARVIGLDLTGYWKCSLGAAAESVGVLNKLDIPEDWHRRERSEFTDEEWKRYEEYARRDPETTLQLYHATVELLVNIDLRVVRKTGLIPPSAPGSAARIAFGLVEDLHPENDRWDRPPRYVDQLGSYSYYAGNVFCARPGVYSGHGSLDITSAYPAVMAVLPDPVTAEYRPVPPAEAFNVHDWLGRFGSLTISGMSTNDLYPPIRIHADGRIRYVAGPFENLSVTIPEIVIGVLRGSLKVGRVHGGVWINGESNTSFLREAVIKFFAIKNDVTLPPAQRTMGKLLANSLYGKLVEANPNRRHVDVETGALEIPDFTAKVLIARTIARLYASDSWEPHQDDYFGADPSKRLEARDEFERRAPQSAESAIEEYVRVLIGCGEKFGEIIRLDDFLMTSVEYNAGQYFLPLFAAQITGLTSAKVALLAESIGAYQGDTDSVHAPMPAGAKCAEQVPGYQRYASLLASSGYDLRVPEFPSLGTWAVETTRPSEETIYVRPKVYSHFFGADLEPKKQYKQAKHGFSKFPRSKSELHSAILTLHQSGSVSYQQRPAPRRLRSAIRTGVVIGEFVGGPVTINRVDNPHMWMDENGWARWLCLNGKRSE